MKWETGVTQTHLPACLRSEVGCLLKFNSGDRNAGAFIHLSAGADEKGGHSHVGSWLSTVLVVASRVSFSFRMLIRAEEDVSDLPRPLSYCGAVWMAGPPLHVFTDLSVIYASTGVGVKGLWGHQHKVGVGCGSPYQVLKTSRHGNVHLLVSRLHHPPGKSFILSDMTFHEVVLVMVLVMSYGLHQQGELGSVVSVSAPPGTVGCC